MIKSLMMATAALALTATSAGSAPRVSIADPCYDNCVLICWKLTGDWAACEISCQGALCVTGLPAANTGTKGVRPQYYPSL